MADQPHVMLFDNPSSLLSWLPGETLFSLVSRQHAFWGYLSASETATILFGRRDGGVHHDIPNELDKLFHTTEGAWGKPDELALNRTLLSFYRPFSSENLIRDCISMMRGKSVNHLKYRLGLLTSSFRANHPLKACPKCMEHGIFNFGWAYWHLEHQFPGVWYCDLHGHPLSESTVKSTGVNRFLWALPDVRYLQHSWADGADANALRKLSTLALKLMGMKRETGWLSGSLVVPVLREAIRRRGWMTPNCNLRSTDLAPSYLDWCIKLRGPLELESLPCTHSDAAAQIGRLLRPWRTGTHPVRLLVAISWLFEDAESFVSAYDHIHLPATEFTLIHDATALPVSSRDEIKRKLLSLVQSGLTATASASALGITVGTAQAWLAQADISVRRRPKSFKSEIQLSIHTSLLGGIDKTTAASKHGISLQAVTRYLRTEPGLHQKWQDAVFLNRQTEARRSWDTAVKSDGHHGVKWLRTLIPAIYAWLYRNDRTWLQANLPQVNVHTSRKPRIDWDARDLILSSQVERTLEKLRSIQPRKPLQLWQLYQAIPQLKPKLSSLERLPLTRQAIERGLGKSRTRSADGLI